MNAPLTSLVSTFISLLGISGLETVFCSIYNIVLLGNFEHFTKLTMSDFDCDNCLGYDDLQQTLIHLTSNELTDEEMDFIIEKVSCSRMI